MPGHGPCAWKTVAKRTRARVCIYFLTPAHVHRRAVGLTYHRLLAPGVNFVGSRCENRIAAPHRSTMHSTMVHALQYHHATVAAPPAGLSRCMADGPCVDASVCMTCLRVLPNDGTNADRTRCNCMEHGFWRLSNEQNMCHAKRRPTGSR